MTYFIADEVRREMEDMVQSIDELLDKVEKMETIIETLTTWMSNVPTDDQLDSRVKALGYQTGREILSKTAGQVFALGYPEEEDEETCRTK